MLVWDRRKVVLYGNGLVGEVNRNNSTPVCKLNGTDSFLYSLYKGLLKAMKSNFRKTKDIYKLDMS